MLLIMQIFEKNFFVWATLCLSLFLEIALVEAGSHPLFGDQRRDKRDADPVRRYNGRRTYNRGRSSGRRFNVAEV